MRPSDLQLTEAVHKPHKGWRACWGRLHCFASSSRKRPKHRPHLLPAPHPSSNGNLQISSEPVPSASSLSPLVHAPPSSPASFSYTDTVPSPAALLTLFPLTCVDDLCNSATARGDSSLRGLDPVLVTPPLHSTLTTEPTTPLSTAPFTPPPELAHLTMPPSPEVPFAELVASSLNFKCGERVSAQTTVEGSMVPTNLQLGYSVFSENPILATEVSSTENPSPLPERVTCFQDDTGPNSIATLLQKASPFGFNQATSADAYGHCSPELAYQHIQQNVDFLHVQAENTPLESGATSREERLQSHDSTVVVEHSHQPRKEEQKASLVLDNGDESRQNEIPELLSANCAQALEDSCFQKIEDNPAFFSSRNTPDSNSVVQRDDSKRQLDSTTDQFSISAICRCVERNMDGTQYTEKCPTCGVLTSKCKALSEALHEAKEKLSLIAEKENMFDDRENKYKQILEWMQLEAKSQQASITRLSEELSWQDSAFLDLQAKYLAELGIELPAVCSNDSSTELPSEV